MDWARIPARKELLARNEYSTAENRILKAQLKGRLKFSQVERATLCEFAHRVGRNALAEVAIVGRLGITGGRPNHGDRR